MVFCFVHYYQKLEEPRKKCTSCRKVVLRGWAFIPNDAFRRKKKWFTCNICSIPVLIQYRLLHNSSHNHIQRTIEPSIQKGTPEVDFRRGGSIELAAFDLKRDEAIKLSRCSQKMFQAIILKMACVLKDFRKRHIRL